LYVTIQFAEVSFPQKQSKKPSRSALCVPTAMQKPPHIT